MAPKIRAMARPYGVDRSTSPETVAKVMPLLLGQVEDVLKVAGATGEAGREPRAPDRVDAARLHRVHHLPVLGPVLPADVAADVVVGEDPHGAPPVALDQVSTVLELAADREPFTGPVEALPGVDGCQNSNAISMAEAAIRRDTDLHPSIGMLPECMTCSDAVRSCREADVASIASAVTRWRSHGAVRRAGVYS